MLKKTRLLFVMLLVVLLIAGCAPSEDVDEGDDETWPNKPLNFIITAGAGGMTDRSVRAVAAFLSAELGVPVLCENITGHGVGYAHFTDNCPQDGSYLISTLQPSFSGRIIQGYDYRIEDYEYLALAIADPIGIFIQDEAPYNDLESLMNYLMANPNQVSWGYQPGGAQHLAFGMIQEVFDFQVREIPYSHGAEHRAAFLGKHLDVITSSFEGTMSIIGEDAFAVAIFADERHPRYPDVPTVKEELEKFKPGTEGSFVMGQYFGFGTAAGIKENYPERYEILANAFEKAITNPDFIALWDQEGLTAGYVGRQDYVDLVYEIDALCYRFANLLTD